MSYQMEELQENWIPHLEMDGDNFFNQQNHMKYLQEQISYPSSTLVEAAYNNNTNFENPLDVFMGDRTCQFNMVDIHEDAAENNILSTHIMPLINSPIDPAFQSAHQVNHGLKPIKRKIRTTSETAEHIASERKRRLKLTRNFIALSAIIPGLKKTEKSYILQEAINYVNQLQERVRELEIENEKINIAYSTMVDKKLQNSTTCEANVVDNYIFNDEFALPDVRARVSEKNVLICIQCEKMQNDNMVHKILSLVTNLHLSITSTNIFPFGASTLQITIIAQMKEEYSLTINDLVKILRKVILESNGV
ncbi:transcription factor bHLH19-like [Vicia villosa]|uniref:transcription factor bHLH19-like n=1 Tax=Vicia villosa TaxID=3911 RepID=UPI00273CAB99|nr:transcription factor bHLH19-like [Vicia villosa]